MPRGQPKTADIMTEIRTQPFVWKPTSRRTQAFVYIVATSSSFGLTYHYIWLPLLTAQDFTLLNLTSCKSPPFLVKVQLISLYGIKFQYITVYGIFSRYTYSNRFLCFFNSIFSSTSLGFSRDFNKENVPFSSTWTCVQLT